MINSPQGTKKPLIRQNCCKGQHHNKTTIKKGQVEGFPRLVEK